MIEVLYAIAAFIMFFFVYQKNKKTKWDKLEIYELYPKAAWMIVISIGWIVTLPMYLGWRALERLSIFINKKK